MLTYKNLLIGNPTPLELPNLIKLTEGVYTKSVVSPLSKKPAPCKPLRTLAIEYLTYLGISSLPSSYDIKYNEGKTTQVPTGRVIGVGSPVDIEFGYNGKYISFEYKESSNMNTLTEATDLFEKHFPNLQYYLIIVGKKIKANFLNIDDLLKLEISQSADKWISKLWFGEQDSIVLYQTTDLNELMQVTKQKLSAMFTDWTAKVN